MDTDSASIDITDIKRLLLQPPEVCFYALVIAIPGH